MITFTLNTESDEGAGSDFAEDNDFTEEELEESESSESLAVYSANSDMDYFTFQKEEINDEKVCYQEYAPVNYRSEKGKIQITFIF